jgi:hypothetical protein
LVVFEKKLHSRAAAALERVQFLEDANTPTSSKRFIDLPTVNEVLLGKYIMP